jgi:nitrogen-specific signal transduction histidine kinase
LLHAICESNPEAIVITDLQTHQILKTNARAEELFGCDLDPSGTRPISLKYLLSTSSANAKSVEEQIDFYAQVGEASGFEQLTLLCPDYRRISLYTTPVRSRSGDILARIWSFRNLTQQLYFEKQLRQMSRLEMNNRMGSTLAHDIKNMLQIMQTNLEEEIEDRTLPEDSPLRQTMRAIEHCSELTQRLMHSDHRITERETCGIQALMNEAVTLLRHITRHNIRIEHRCYDASLNVRVNKEQIMQTLLNLCLNAADAMPDSGEIRLRILNIQADHAEQYG